MLLCACDSRLSFIREHTADHGDDPVFCRHTRSIPHLRTLLARSSTLCWQFLDGGNSKDACAASGRRAFPRASSANAQKGGPGTFQKVSVDEAYLEPTRRTLLAELLLSSQRKTTQPASAATEPAMTSASAATATRTATRDFLLPRSGRTHGDEGGASGCGPPLVEPPAQQWRYGGTDRDAQSSSRHRGRASGSQDGDDSAEESGWEMSVGYGSLDSDRQSNEWAERRRKGGGSARANRDEEDEEDRLLEAGGLLAARIQQTLSDVLQYDCSIGVASNKVNICIMKALQW